MSYIRKFEYTIIPEESFRIIRNCSGCGCKAVFHNTNYFRVNANGNKVDVWLIYQCIKCKHTNNLTIYERRRPESIDKLEYEKFISNSSDLAFEYGTDIQFFTRNKAEVDWTNIKYKIEEKFEKMNGVHSFFHPDDLLVLDNPFVLKIRTDKIVSNLLNLSRAQIKALKEAGIILVTEVKSEHKIQITIEREINRTEVFDVNQNRR